MLELQALLQSCACTMNLKTDAEPVILPPGSLLVKILQHDLTSKEADKVINNPLIEPGSKIKWHES